MKKLLMMLLVMMILLVTAGNACGQSVWDSKWEIPVQLKIEAFVQIIPTGPIILERADGNNFEGQTILRLRNNFPMRISAEITNVGITIADSYKCKLGDNTAWEQISAITTGIHLFGQPEDLLLRTRLENVNMGKVAYQDDLLDVAQVVITVLPAAY